MFRVESADPSVAKPNDSQRVVPTEATPLARRRIAQMKE